MAFGIVRKNGGLLALAAVGVVVALRSGAHAADPDRTQKSERCASRVAAAVLGRGPTSELLASTAPQTLVASLLETPQFHDHFARFLNARFNIRPGATPGEDASYYLAKHVLEKKLPYRDLFVGKFSITTPEGAAEPVIADDPEGLGYFRSPVWLRRYAGNEAEGLKIVTAYRILNNTVGLKLLSTTIAPDGDSSATGREAAACRGCHKEGWSGLDRVAAVLTRANRSGAELAFDPPQGGPQNVANADVSNDAELVTALVDSQTFEFNACRISFEFLYGRPESACESPVFDSCMTAFHAQKTIQSAIVAVATDPTFCQ